MTFRHPDPKFSAEKSCMLLAIARFLNGNFAFPKRFITSKQAKIYRIGHRPIKHFLKLHDPTLNKFGPRLAWVLRHAAPSLGIYMRPDGYALIQDVLRLGPFGRMTIADLVSTSKMDPEKRTEVKQSVSSHWWIRATGRHSIDFVRLGWKEMDSSAQALYIAPASEWNHIRLHGLRRGQNERYIHLRKNIPEDYGYSQEGPFAAIAVYIDVANAIVHGFSFFVNRNGEVIADCDYIAPRLFQKVEQVQWSKITLWDSREENGQHNLPP